MGIEEVLFMSKTIDFFKDDKKRTMLFLLLSGISLIFSFLKINILPFDAAWIPIILCGIPIIKEALEGLITSFDIKADVLVSLALIASVIIGEIFAAGEVAFIMTIGALLEDITVEKARTGIENLIHLSPQIARTIKNGVETIIPAKDVQVGDILRVLPGETIAVDGIITTGQTSIDQSVMTGESLPVDKQPGDQVSSGTVNQFGSFDMKATKVGKDSSLQRMIRLVQSADAGKAKIVGVADRWATWIVVIALVSAALTWIITGEIIRAVTILVVFCPCALVLATPTAIMAGIGNATKYGILVREGDALERLSKVKRIAFDKTGTLTHGKPKVTEVYSASAKWTKDQLLYLTASAEMRSEHPLGKAILNYYKENSEEPLIEPKDFQMLPGRGVYSNIENNIVLAGNEEFLHSNFIDIISEIRKYASEFISRGCTITYVAINKEAVGFIALSDTLRGDTKDMIKNIESMGVKTVLLTGDHKEAANHIGKLAGIDTVEFDCLPEDKLNAIEEYESHDEYVCMVGDGINDAPSLKKAYVGIAMGGIGSDIAVDAADIALVRDDIKYLPHLLGLSKRMMKTIHINLGFSMGLNFLAIVLAMIGTLNPVLGALVHNAGSVLVIINSALLLKWKNKYS